MIPKNLFFIWFGDNKPNYVDFTIKAFKEVNPDFNIQLIWYKIKDIDNCQDEILKKCIDISCNKEFKEYKRWKESSHKRFTYILRFQEIYRFELIKKYGGIYCDCDMFPIKKFDSSILNCKNFCCNTFWSTDYTKRNRDICFFGCQKDIQINDYDDFEKIIDIVPFDFLNNKKWLLYKEKFYNCQLKIGETCNNNYYIDHYVQRTWKNNLIEKCKYDRG